MAVLFLNHQQQRCGVYQMGRRIGGALSEAGVVQYWEARDLTSAVALTQGTQPEAVIYNWHPATIPWASEFARRLPGAKHIGLIHEIAPGAAAAGSDIFQYRVVCDPSFPVDKHHLFRTVRHVPRYDGPVGKNEVITIGSFGFAVGGKKFATVVHAVGAEFPGALVRLRIPNAHYGDDNGALSKQLANAASAVTIGNVRVEVEHEFLDEPQLLQWLASNDMNVFFYEHNGWRGISSAIDYAIAARRPIAINDSQMFRHLSNRLGTFPERSLQESLQSLSEVEALYDEWAPEQLVRDYVDMLSILEVS